MAQFRSFEEQLTQFLERPHESVPERPIVSPAAWKTADLAAADSLVTLAPEDISRLGSAVELAMGANIAIEDVTTASVPVPGLAARAQDWRTAIAAGRGFVVVRGLPVAAWGEEKSAYAFWTIGHYLGVPGAQNPDNELLGHVTDYAEFQDNPNVRRYRTAGNIDFHCDPADVVGLLCLHTAKSGGQSRIASSVAVFNAMLEEDANLVRPLFGPTAFDRRDEEAPGELGYVNFQPCCHGAGTLRTFYHSEYFRSAARHFDPPRLTTELSRTLDRFDELANAPEYRFDMWLEPGDMQFLSNHVIVHARTEYEDWPQPENRRHLLRLWLSL